MPTLDYEPQPDSGRRQRFNARRVLLALIVLLLASIPVGILYAVVFDSFVDVRYLCVAFVMAFILALFRAVLASPGR